MKRTPQKPYAEFTKRLTKCLGPTKASVVQALVKEMRRYKEGVDGDRFRVRFKDRLDEIDGLTSRFLREDFEDGRVYRPTVLSLAVAGTDNALKQLVVIDKVIRFLAEAYEDEPHQPVTIGQISNVSSIALEALYDAFGYIREMTLGGGHSSSIPDDPEWYFVPGETLLRLPDLNAVLERDVKWVEDESKARKQVTYPSDGHANWNDRWTARLTGWIGRNKILSFFYVTATLLVAVLFYVLNVTEAIGRIMGVFDVDN